MRKLDWYIIKKFLGTFFFSISLILVIVVIFDVSEKIDDFIENDVPFNAIIFDYYLNFIPYFGNLFSPLFTFTFLLLSPIPQIVPMLSHHHSLSLRQFLPPF